MNGKRVADINIGIRAAQEIYRLYPKKKQAMQALGCADNTIYSWENGIAPSAYFLQRMHELGADVIWILTGRKEKHDGNHHQRAV